MSVIQVLLIFLFVWFIISFFYTKRKFGVSGPERKLMNRNMIYIYVKNPLKDEFDNYLTVSEDLTNDFIADKYYRLVNIQKTIIEDLSIINSYFKSLNDYNIRFHSSASKILNLENDTFLKNILSELPLNITPLVQESFTSNITDLKSIGIIQLKNNFQMDQSDIKITPGSTTTINVYYADLRVKTIPSNVYISIDYVNLPIKEIKYDTKGKLDKIVVLNNTTETLNILINTDYNITISDDQKSNVLNEFLFDQSLDDEEVLVVVNGKQLSVKSDEIEKTLMDYRPLNFNNMDILDKTYTKVGCYPMGNVYSSVIGDTYGLDKLYWLGNNMTPYECKIAAEKKNLNYFSLSRTKPPTSSNLDSDGRIVYTKSMLDGLSYSNNVCYASAALNRGGTGINSSTQGGDCSDVNNVADQLVYEKINMNTDVVTIIETPPYKNARRQKIYQFLLKSLF